ncbi:unnamed protein product [Aureobasidium pullulans]|nr:unnamed protein product [Aureobasidium pullulans]
MHDTSQLPSRHYDRGNTWMLQVHYNIAAFSEAQENVAEAPADFRLNITPKTHSNLKKEEAILDLHRRLSYVVKIDYGNDKIAYEALVIDYSLTPAITVRDRAVTS